MFKQPENSQGPASASEDLVERLKAAADDAVLLREIVESSDRASITAAFAMLFSGSSSPVPNKSLLQKKTRNRPCSRTPNETFVEILLFADRDVLDAMQLACRFLFQFIRDREVKELPLRSIAQVQIGEFCRRSWKWMPVVEVDRHSATVSKDSRDRYEDYADWELGEVDERWCISHEDKNGPYPKTVRQLVSFLRLAYCASVCIDLRWTRSLRGEHYGVARDAVFDDLVVSNTFVNVLTVCVDECSVFYAHCAFEAFKPLSEVIVSVDDCSGWSRYFNDAFFISAAECGVRSIKFASARSYIGIGVLAALSFGFAVPITGGDRIIRNVSVHHCYDDKRGLPYDPDAYRFPVQLIKKASELDGRQHIDFKFTISGFSQRDDFAGIEKYQKDKSSWLINDLENGVTLEVVQAKTSVEIHVFSLI